MECVYIHLRREAVMTGVEKEQGWLAWRNKNEGEGSIDRHGSEVNRCYGSVIVIVLVSLV